MGATFKTKLMQILLLISVVPAALGAAWDCSKQVTCAACTGMSHLVDSVNPGTVGTPQAVNQDLNGTQLIGCTWCPKSGNEGCHAYGSLFNPCNSEEYLKFTDTCPIDYPEDKTVDFLPDWMGTLQPILGSMTILDLSLPGTHDTLTYDLSTTVSDGGIDDYPELSKVLNLFSSKVDIIPGQIEDFIRLQARTQGLTVTQQVRCWEREKINELCIYVEKRYQGQQ